MPPEPSWLHWLSLCATYRQSYACLFLKTLATLQLERGQVQQLYKQAHAQLMTCKQNLQQKDEQLRPLREVRDQQNKARDAVRSSGGELAVRSEEELDAKLAEMHHRQQHESLTVNDEKRLLQQIKLLEVRSSPVCQQSLPSKHLPRQCLSA